jgi:hypothetical protein
LLAIAAAGIAVGGPEFFARRRAPREVEALRASLAAEVPLYVDLLIKTREMLKSFRTEFIRRDRIGPVATFKMAVVVARLPKTRSGKNLRGTMKKIADQDAWTTPATIEDPKALDEIKEALGAHAR